MRRLDTTLCDGVRYEEEVELSIDDLRLLDEASVNVGALRWVIYPILAVRATRLLEEALTHTLVNNDERDIGRSLGRCLVITTVLHGHDTVKLCELLINDLLAHRVTDTITVDEDVSGHSSIIKLTVRRECALEVVREDCG